MPGSAGPTMHAYRTMSLLALAGACGGREEPPQPRALPDAIVGEWELWCRTDAPETTRCLARDGSVTWRFGRDGTVTRRSRYGTYGGTWTLVGDQLELALASTRLQVTEAYRLRLVDGVLVFWDPRANAGAIHGRAGAVFVPAPGPTSARVGPTTHELDGVRYQLALPRGYRLARDHHHRQRWDPAAGDGLTFEIHVRDDSGDTATDPRHRAERCETWQLSQTGKGVNDREVSVSAHACIPGTPLSIWCSASHTRGYLEGVDAERGYAVCATLAVERELRDN